MFTALIQSMRPKQWIKNTFVFAAIVFDRQLSDLTALIITFTGFMIFCLLSSSVYLINDALDIEADRQHPQKKFRPIASGRLPVQIAITAALIIVVMTIPLAFILSTSFGSIALAYLLINLAYSNWLKHVPLIDVLIIALGFVLRVAGGVSLITVERFSPWLYVCTTLLALYFGFGKRRGELTLLTEGNNSTRSVLDGYSIAFLDQLLVIVSSSTIMAYSLYTFSAPNLPPNSVMMLTIPFVLYAIFRYLYLIQIKKESGAPDELVLTDRPLQITFALWGLSVLIIFYFL